ncbi:hypothetical protein HMPREF9439_02144 [Parasutterella excrementihominis YIT 11859]|uniref:Uncharacterized protein n=1 Tax=Parasutterella excrementihominis YIT 11859 TaxID=762966 RepID=F3QMG8_9BURK|nr:hypothetical protein HMPREF9439_02144 [Parasutterella excrementihominis YIT 11859]
MPFYFPLPFGVTSDSDGKYAGACLKRVEIISKKSILLLVFHQILNF